jgi:hypothetical protein
MLLLLPPWWLLLLLLRRRQLRRLLRRLHNGLMLLQLLLHVGAEYVVACARHDGWCLGTVGCQHDLLIILQHC